MINRSHRACRAQHAQRRHPSCRRPVSRPRGPGFRRPHLEFPGDRHRRQPRGRPSDRYRPAAGRSRRRLWPQFRRLSDRVPGLLPRRPRACAGELRADRRRAALHPGPVRRPRAADRAGAGGQSRRHRRSEIRGRFDGGGELDILATALDPAAPTDVDPPIDDDFAGADRLHLRNDRGAQGRDDDAPGDDVAVLLRHPRNGFFRRGPGAWRRCRCTTPRRCTPSRSRRCWSARAPC